MVQFLGVHVKGSLGQSDNRRRRYRSRTYSGLSPSSGPACGEKLPSLKLPADRLSEISFFLP